VLSGDRDEPEFEAEPARGGELPGDIRRHDAVFQERVHAHGERLATLLPQPAREVGLRLDGPSLIASTRRMSSCV